MRLVLHIGMGKTGTSTLQSELAAQARMLAEHGICYPVVSRAPDHSALNCLVRPLDRVPRQYRTTRRNDEDAMRRFGEETWSSILRRVRSSGAEVTVLSSEHFFYLDRDEVTRLRDLLAGEFSEITVVAYVRSPPDYYVAVMQQVVRASDRIVSPADYRIPLRNCLERHRGAFGDLVVRAFDRDRLVAGDVVADFAAVGFPNGPSLRRDERRPDVNETMSAEAMCILQQFRSWRYPDRNDVFDADTVRVREGLSAVAEVIPQTRARLRPTLAEIVYENHRADIEWLATEFGIELRPPDVEPSVRGADDLLGAHEAGDPSAVTLDQLVDVLAVDRSSVDATLYALVHELAVGARPSRVRAAIRTRVDRVLRAVRQR